MPEVSVLADRLFDTILDHYPLRANLMGLRDDGALTDHSEEAGREFLRRYQALGAEAELLTPRTIDEHITQGLVRHLVRAECEMIEEMIEDAEAAVRRAEAVAPQWFRTAGSSSTRCASGRRQR